MEIFSKSAEETKKIGRRLSADFSGGEIICFKGDLGAGKTTFVQGLAEGLGIEKRVTSPTFILMRKYKVKHYKNVRIRNLYHIDLYRLETAIENELINLGIKDIWGKPENVVVIEWGDKATGIYPKNTVWVELKEENNGRKINIK